MLDILTDIGNPYIVIDALDESPSPYRQGILSVLKDIFNQSTHSMHVLCTSRQDQDIQSAIQQISKKETIVVAMQNDGSRVDIERHVREDLQHGQLAQKAWSNDLKQQIVRDLTKKANGLFLYVVCQLNELNDCYGEGQVRDALGELPKSIEDTYARILQKIPQRQQARARVMLQWLTSSGREMTVKEIAEAVIIDPENDPPVRISQRYMPPDGILRVLSHLIEIKGDWVILAHLSVKDYLSSDTVYVRDSFGSKTTLLIGSFLEVI